MVVTLKDVAEKAGVSIGTVSRIVNGKDSDIRISKATRKKVLDIVEEVSYHPNQYARSLRTQKTCMLGVCASYMFDPYTSKIMSGINMAAAPCEYRLMHSALEQESTPVDAFRKVFNKSSVDGVIVLEYESKLDSDTLKELWSEGIKIVTVGRTVENSPIPSVHVDNVKGGFLAAEHLLSLGHRRIAYMEWKEAPDSHDRFKGMEKAFAKYGLEIDPELVIKNIYPPEPFNLSRHSYEDMSKYLNDHDAPTALFAVNDVYAFGAITALMDKGFSVPGDVAVVGFDNMDNVSAYYNPPLTTIHPPVIEAGKRAVELLIDFVENGDDEDVPPRVVLEPELIIRASSGDSVHKKNKSKEDSFSQS